MAGLVNGTTDSEGNVVLQYQEVSKGAKTYYAELDTGEISSTVSVDIIGVDYLEMRASNTIISDGQTSRITARAIINNEPVPNLAINIGAETFKTNDNGEAYLDYEGTGAGIVTVNSACGGETTYVIIEDVLMYYSKENNKAINFNYNASNNLTVLLDTKGIYMVSPANVFGLMYFGHIAPLDYPDIIFEFDVLNFTTNVTGGNNISDTYAMIVCGVEVSVTQAKLNQRIRVEISEGYKKTYVGNTLIDSRAFNETFFPQIQLGRNNSITIDNLKYTKGDVE